MFSLVSHHHCAIWWKKKSPEWKRDSLFSCKQIEWFFFLLEPKQLDSNSQKIKWKMEWAPTHTHFRIEFTFHKWIRFYFFTSPSSYSAKIVNSISPENIATLAMLIDGIVEAYTAYKSNQRSIGLLNDFGKPTKSSICIFRSTMGEENEEK